jgi:hypothetical protein
MTASRDNSIVWHNANSTQCDAKPQLDVPDLDFVVSNAQRVPKGSHSSSAGCPEGNTVGSRRFQPTEDEPATSLNPEQG